MQTIKLYERSSPVQVQFSSHHLLGINQKEVIKVWQDDHPSSSASLK